MKNLSTTKSNDLISDFFRGQASRPYIRIGIHLLTIEIVSHCVCVCVPEHLFSDAYLYLHLRMLLLLFLFHFFLFLFGYSAVTCGSKWGCSNHCLCAMYRPMCEADV